VVIITHKPDLTKKIKRYKNKTIKGNKGGTVEDLKNLNLLDDEDEICVCGCGQKIGDKKSTPIEARPGRYIVGAGPVTSACFSRLFRCWYSGKGEKNY